MKKKLLRLLAFLTMIVFCINNVGSVQALSSPIPKPDPTVPVSGIVLTPNNRTMTIGQTMDISVSIYPSNATDKSVTWSTTNRNVATVSSTGRVTAVGYGSAIILGRTSNGKIASSSITVRNMSSEATTTETTVQYPTTEATVQKPTTEAAEMKTTEEATTRQPATTAGTGNRSDTYTTQQPIQTTQPPVNGQQAEQNNTTSMLNETLKKGDILSTSSFLFKVTNVNKKTVSCVQAQGKKKTKIVIPDSVQYKGAKYKVTAIDKFAFKNNKKVKKVVIGKNVRVIGKQAFYGCKNLKQVYIYSKKLTKVGSKAFKNTGKKLAFGVPKGKTKKYSKLLEGKK